MQRGVLVDWQHGLSRFEGGNGNTNKVGNGKRLYQLVLHYGSTLIVHVRRISKWHVFQL
jgi:hypothetical protein